MSLTSYPTLRLKVSEPPALKLKISQPASLKLQFLPAVPGFNASATAAALENKVNRTGDTMTGTLMLFEHPTATSPALQAATKQYVDSSSGGGGGGITDGDKGDITVSGSGATWTIDADAVTYAKMQNVSATARFLGRFSAGAGDTEEGTGTQATALLDVFTSTLKGIAPLSGGGTVNFLRADGTWATPPGGGGAPVGAEYITSTADATLTAERVLTDTATITWDRTTAGQIKANTAAGGGNVSNSGTPALDQVGVWVTATTIKGIGGTANQVLRIASAGTTPSFGAVDVSQAAAVTGRLAFANLTQGTARSVLGVTGNATADAASIQGATDQVLRVNGAGTALAFGAIDLSKVAAATGILQTASHPALTGDVTTAGGAVATTIANDAVTYAKMQNVSAASLLIGRGSAAGAGDPQEITLGTGLSMTGTTLAASVSGGNVSNSGTPSAGQVAEWVTATTIAGVSTYAKLASPVFTGDPQAPTPAAGDNDTSIATTAFTTANSVRNDLAQSLTSTQQVQARSNIYAAPFDAMAYSGMQINGSMEVGQELGTTGTALNGAYICDGFKHQYAGTMSIASSRFNSPAFFPPFNYFIATSITTAQSVLGANDYVIISQLIEGWRIAKLGWGTANAQPITIGFWTKHHRAGIYSVVLRNPTAYTRCYPATYTQNVADATEYKTITIPGETTGVWASENTTGIELNFTLASGTTLTSPSANTWLNGVFLGAFGQVNAAATTADSFRITGVVVLPGIEAPSAARSPLIMRPYDQELATCMRYWELATNEIWGYQVAAGFIEIIHPFKVTKRAVPTMGAVGWSSTGNGINQAVSVPTIYGCTFSASAVTTGTVFFRGMSSTADARL